MAYSSWKYFEREALPLDPNDPYRKEVQHIFYAGFFSFFHHYAKAEISKFKKAQPFNEQVLFELEAIKVDPQFFDKVRAIMRDEDFKVKRRRSRSKEKA